MRKSRSFSVFEFLGIQYVHFTITASFGGKASFALPYSISGLPQQRPGSVMAPRKKDKAKSAARKHKRAGKDVLRELFDMCPGAEGGGEINVSHDGKVIEIHCPKLISLPESIGTLDGLQVLNLSECPKLLELPHTIGGLKALTELDLSDCTSLAALPAEIGDVEDLRELDLSGCSSLVALPSGFGYGEGFLIVRMVS